MFMFIVASTHVQHKTNSEQFVDGETMQNRNVLLGRYNSLIRYVNKSKKSN